VVLVEAGRIGRGNGGSSASWIAIVGRRISRIEKALGRRAARHVWRSWHRSALDFGRCCTDST
jgi:hypothetical protein